MKECKIREFVVKSKTKGDDFVIRAERFFDSKNSILFFVGDDLIAVWNGEWQCIYPAQEGELK